jgi:hypothetical protein
MKRTVEVTELSGFNESPVAGEYIISLSRDYTTRHVIAGVSVLSNHTTGLSAAVTGVTATMLSVPGLKCNPGDFYVVSLATPWTIQNDDLPIIEVECNLCGWSYPKKELVGGRCKVCIDKPNKI